VFGIERVSTTMNVGKKCGKKRARGIEIEI